MESPTAKKKSGNWNIRPVHRIVGTIILVFTLYFAVTGTMIQLVDLRAILSHAPATDPEMVQVREGINGPANYVVIQPADYAAPPLPASFDFNTALTTVLHAAHQAAGAGTALNYVELREVGGKPIGVVRASDRTLRFDATSGQALAGPGGQRGGGNAGGGRGAGAGAGAAAGGGGQGQQTSLHSTFKTWHRLQNIGNWFALFNALVALALLAMIVTGLVLYFQLLRARSRGGLKGMFWTAGGWWRSLHRGVSVVAAIFLLVVSISGTMLALDAFGLGLYQVTHKDAGKYARFLPGAVDDFSSPLADDKLPAMLTTTLSAGQATSGASPIKAVRLRYFNGIPQGVLIAGDGDNTAQFVFNADSGKPMTITEPGYPPTHYHLGWKEHEIVKKIHRGDVFGLPGRLMDLFAGLSLIFLSISGFAMYIDLWRRRRRGGRTALFWT
jgi:uncharacterized iron-regulated membrane protein